MAVLAWMPGAPGDGAEIGYGDRVVDVDAGEVCSRDGAGIGHIGGNGPDAVVATGDGAGIGYIGCIGDDAVEVCSRDGAGMVTVTVVLA